MQVTWHEGESDVRIYLIGENEVEQRLIAKVRSLMKTGCRMRIPPPSQSVWGNVVIEIGSLKPKSPQ
ncbi:MAG: hypothetical protein ACUVXI_04665 [bacterium]